MRRITVLSVAATALLGLAVFIHPAIGVPIVDPPPPPIPGGSGPAGGTPVTDVVTLDAHLSNTHLLQGGDGQLFLQLDVTGQEAVRPTATSRLPMNLAIVIDRSGSMESQNKMAYARQAAEFLVDQLLPADRVSLVAYNQGVEVLLASQRVGDGNEVKQSIRRLKAGGNTNLHGGMVAGAAQVQRHLASRQVNRVILISDGLANVGPSDTPTLSRIAQTWGGRGIAVSAMGVGADFNEDLMLNLAEYSGGNYYYIDEPTKLAGIFERELTQLVATVAQQATVSVTLADGVQCLDVPGYTFQQAGQTVTVPLGDLAAGAMRRILVSLRVPTDAPGDYQVAQSVLHYIHGEDGRERNVETPALGVERTGNRDAVAAHANKTVLEQNERVNAATVVDRAMQLFEAGKQSAAAGLLRAEGEALRQRNADAYDSDDLAAQSREMTELAGRVADAASPESRPAKDLRKRAKEQAYHYKK